MFDLVKDVCTQGSFWRGPDYQIYVLVFRYRSEGTGPYIFVVENLQTKEQRAVTGKDFLNTFSRVGRVHSQQSPRL